MSLNFAKAILAGNLTRDPELKYTQNQMPICEIGIAINSRRKDRESVSFFDAVAFGKTAETISRYFKKGEPILLECEPRQETWESRDGSKRSKVSFIVQGFTFVRSKREAEEGGYERGAPPERQPQHSEKRGWQDKSEDFDVPF